MPNLVKLGWTAAEIWRSFDFSRWRPPPSWILKIPIFLTFMAVKRVELHHRAKFRQNRPNCGWDMAIFRFFKMATAAILDFWNYKFLTVGTVKMFEMLHHAKFDQNRLNRGWYITIFWFFQDGGRPPSWICNACVGTTHERHLVVFITVQNLVGIAAVVLKICTFFYFETLAWKRLFTPQNWGFLGFWPPKWGAMWKIPQKGTSLRESASFEPSRVKVRRSVWPVGEFLKKGA